MDDRPLQWRVDASTSRAVRTLWAFGAGTFFAIAAIVVSWRLYDLLRELAGWPVAAGTILALAATVVGVALSDDADRLARRLPVSVPTGGSTDRSRDVVVATVAMTAVVVALMGIGRIVSQRELLAVGAGPFTLLAALLIPFALLALLLASFLRSVGTLDAEEGVLHLHDPDDAVPLEHVERVRRFGELAPVRLVAAAVAWLGRRAPVRLVVSLVARLWRAVAARLGIDPAKPFGGLTAVKLEYATPGGQYVPGPRWLVLPAAVARELRAVAED